VYVDILGIFIMIMVERSGFVEHIGLKLQMLRRNKRITQAELAEVLSVSAQSVSKWENGLSTPDISILPIIARYYGITMDELFNYRLDALNYKERFIRFMADNGVLQFGQFRLKSGRQSPYVIDSSQYRFGSQIMKLGEFYAECIREHNIECSVLAANSVREIPILIAANIVLFNRYGLDIPYCIGTSVGKRLAKNDKAVLIVDTITSGATLRAYLDSLEPDARAAVTDVITSVDRAEKGEGTLRSSCCEIERKYGVRIHSIVTVKDILRAIENGVVGNREYYEKLMEYTDTYGGN